MSNGIVRLELSLEMTDQVFSYLHHDSGKLLHFNTSLLGRIYKQAPKLFKRITFEITPDIYAMVMKYRGIEEPQVAAITEARMQEPGLAVIFPEDRSSVTVDGHHRLVKRYRAGLREMDFLYTMPLVWKHCLMPATPEEAAAIRADLPPSPDNKIVLGSRGTLHDD